MLRWQVETGVRTDDVEGDVHPRVSMLLPVHNGARWLEAAIDSVLDQSFSDFELIIVDDGSVDRSPAILTAAAARDTRIRHYRLDNNIGLPAALNFGFAKARGEFHSWTSDDNLLRPMMLERLVSVLDAHRDIDIVHADYRIIDEEGVEQGLVPAGPSESLLFGNRIGACFLYRSTVFDALGGYEVDLFGVEDYDFWLRAARQFRFHALHEDLYLYRKHGGSLTSTRSRQIHDLTVKLVEQAMPDTLPAAVRGEILLALALRNLHRWRLDLVLRALRANPRHAASKLPELIRWTLATGYHRIRQS